MAIFLITRKYLVVFLALVAFNGSILTHGRQLKPLNQHSSSNKGTLVPPVKPNIKVHSPSSEKNKVDSSAVPKGVETALVDSSGTNAFRPTTPGNSPGVGHHAQEDKVVKAKVVVQIPDVKDYVTEGIQNGFKPTDPGHSPGVGHHAQEDKDVKAKVVVQSPDVKVYVTEGTENGFKPTDPGHSPGVGHSQQNKIGN